LQTRERHGRDWAERVTDVYLGDVHKSFQDEDQGNESRKNLLGKTRHVLHQRAQIERDEQKSKQR